MPARKKGSEVGEKVGGHEGAVAVAHDGDAFGVDDTDRGAVVDGGLCGGDELLGVGVVGELAAFADDGDRGVLEDGVAGEGEGHGREGGDAREAVGRAGDLAGGGAGFVLGGVGLHEGGERALGFVVAGGEPEGGRELDAVGARVVDELAGGELDAGVGVGEFCELREVVGGGGVGHSEVVGWVGDGLAADEELVVGEEGDGVGEEVAGGAEEDGFFAAGYGEGGDEGLFAFGCGARGDEVDGAGVRGELKDLVAGCVCGEERAAGRVVAVLRGALVERRWAWLRVWRG